MGHDARPEGDGAGTEAVTARDRVEAGVTRDRVEAGVTRDRVEAGVTRGRVEAGTACARGWGGWVCAVGVLRAYKKREGERVAWIEVGGSAPGWGGGFSRTVGEWDRAAAAR
ncbi:hypothetical protein Alo02nite_93510 [Actinoplanes lobatus]|uniref:Uncharacterized protein n=1 Tax=Actinoplanes lobatus TaxID=113568 RepID=A0ABQ4AZM5_9ACTN|nr:hypothetical protein Alo02nite_93510 [Actinoplanes lobatus]